MIGMIISLLLVGGMVTLFVNNQQTYRYNEEMARVQENTRFATEFLQRNFRMTGHLGCGYMSTANGAGGILPASITNTPTIDFNQTTAISAIAGTGGTMTNLAGPGAAAGTDVISILYATGASARLTSSAAKNSTDMVINSNAMGFVQGDAAIVADCFRADVFHISNVPASGNNVSLEHKVAGNFNLTDTLANGYEYPAGSRVMRLQSRVFYVGRPTAFPTGAPPYWSLYIDGVEMVAGIADIAGAPAFRVRYGLPAAGAGAGAASRTVAQYVPFGTMTTADWANVIALQFEFVVTSPNDNTVAQPMTINFNGATTTAGDRRMYSTASTTVALRNRF
jgi:type IV pilus assembly protein PilW